jgi:hypothetical protein
VSLPWLEGDDRAAVLNTWRERAGARVETAERITIEEFRDDIRRGVGR